MGHGGLFGKQVLTVWSSYEGNLSRKRRLFLGQNCARNTVGLWDCPRTASAGFSGCLP